MENITQENITDANQPLHNIACNAESKRAAKRISGQNKKLKPWIWILSAVILVALAISIPLIHQQADNTYQTPLDTYIEIQNSRIYSSKDSLKLLNGFAEDSCSTILSIYAQSNSFDTQKAEKAFQAKVKEYTSSFGDLYKFSYTIEDKERLDHDSLSAFQSEMKDSVQGIKDIIDATKDFEHKDWAETADTSGLSVLQLKTLIGALKSLHSEFKNAQVTEGYKLTLTVSVDGTDLDKPEEHSETVCVYKVDGRWVIEDFWEYAFSLMK